MSQIDKTTLWKIFNATYLEVILFFVVLALCIWLILWIKSILQKDENLAVNDQLILNQMAELYRQGDLSEEEFRSIKSRVSESLKSSYLSETKTENQEGEAEASKEDETEKTKDEEIES